MFYPGCTKTKEEDDRYWRRHPITLPTMPEQPLNDTTDDINELRDRLLNLELELAWVSEVKRAGPASNQEVYQLKHLVNKLMERVNQMSKRQAGSY